MLWWPSWMTAWQLCNKMRYEEQVNIIESLPRFGQASGLGRMRRLMARLGDPQKELRFVHIAGSNGKGSTAVFCDSILRHAGYRTGLFMSPYIYDFRERIQLSGELVDKELFARGFDAVMPVVEEMATEGEQCVQFEVITALALWIFRAAACEVVVLEVGIGGMLDSTNIIDAPLAAVITSLSLEHTGMLGNTLTEIAGQKCGIIKEGCRVAAYCDLPAEAEAVVRSTCAQKGIVPAIAARNKLTVYRSDASGSTFAYDGQTYRIAMAGAHQVYNSLTALMAVNCLREAGLEISQAAVEEGLLSAAIPGRLQYISGTPDVLLDGAHNPEKIRSLCAFLDANFPEKEIVTVMGMLDTKDDAACVPLVAARSKAFVATLPPDGRAVGLGRMQALAAVHTTVYGAEDPAEAAKMALQLCPPEGLVLVCGSMYLLSAAKEGLRPENDKI